MRLKDYMLNETFNYKKLESILLKCSDIMKVYKSTKNFLCRGVDSGIDTIIRKKPRKRRLPRDTPIEIHHMADKMFMDKFGWRPRSGGVFVTSDEDDAYSYGYAYIFLPVNGYSFLWSPNVDDFTEYLRDKGILKHGYEISVPLENVKGQLKDIIKTYKKTNLKQAIASGNEIMFNCIEYYLIGESLFEDMEDIIGI